MKTKMWMLMLLLVVAGLDFNSAAVNAGDPIGDPFMGIQAQSNGSNTGTGEGDPCYQCPDLAKDFAREYHFTPRIGEVICAARMWNLLPDNYGYTAIENDSSLVQPQAGDFVIWWTTNWQNCDSGSGHVAIVSKVKRTEIEVFEQNIQVATPYRPLPMSQNMDRTWRLARGEHMGASYQVKGWLRYPGFNVVGRYSSGQVFHQEIKDCWTRENSYYGVGWPIEDGGGVFVYFWIIPDQPPQYLCQNFRSALGAESIIMHGAPYTGQAHLISGQVWEYYRFGYAGPDKIQHYGPDIRLPNGKMLGGPMSDEENGVQWFGEKGERHGYYSQRLLDFLPAKSGEKQGETYQIAVELHQADGTLVETYYPDGSLSALTLMGQPMSQNHNALAWLGGPVASSYRVLGNGTEIVTTPLQSWVETNLLPGTTRRYQVVALAEDGTELASSNEVIVVSPGQAGSFLLQGAPDGFNNKNLTTILNKDKIKDDKTTYKF